MSDSSLEILDWADISMDASEEDHELNRSNGIAGLALGKSLTESLNRYYEIINADSCAEVASELNNTDGTQYERDDTVSPMLTDVHPDESKEILGTTRELLSVITSPSAKQSREEFLHIPSKLVDSLDEPLLCRSIYPAEKSSNGSFYSIECASFENRCKSERHDIQITEDAIETKNDDKTSAVELFDIKPANCELECTQSEESSMAVEQRNLKNRDSNDDLDVPSQTMTDKYVQESKILVYPRKKEEKYLQAQKNVLLKEETDNILPSEGLNEIIGINKDFSRPQRLKRDKDTPEGWIVSYPWKDKDLQKNKFSNPSNDEANIMSRAASQNVMNLRKIRYNNEQMAAMGLNNLNIFNPLHTTKLDHGFVHWLKNIQCWQKISHHTKTALNVILTTLDPGMENSFLAGPDMVLFVITDDAKVTSAIGKAFTTMFPGKSDISVMPVTANSTSLPAEPVGFDSALLCAESKINYARYCQFVPQNSVVISLSPALVEITPLRWYNSTCIMLDDPRMKLSLHVYTQTTPVPNEYVHQAQMKTPRDYCFLDLGLTTTIGEVISDLRGTSKDDWQKTTCDVSCYTAIEHSAMTLAGMYKRYVDGWSKCSATSNRI